MLDKEDFYDLGLDDEFDEKEIDDIFEMGGTTSKSLNKDNGAADNDTLAAFISSVVSGVLERQSKNRYANENGIDSNGKYKYGIDPRDYDTKAEYREALQEAEEEYVNALDEAEDALDEASDYLNDALSAIDEVKYALGCPNTVLDKSRNSLLESLKFLKEAQNAFNELK